MKRRDGVVIGRAVIALIFFGLGLLQLVNDGSAALGVGLVVAALGVGLFTAYQLRAIDRR